MSYCIIYIDRIDGIGKIKQFLLISLEVCKKKNVFPVANESTQH